MALTRDKLALPKEVRNDLITRVQKKSAFATLARTIEMTDEVATQSFADLAPASFRQEGTLKPAGELNLVTKTMRLQYLASVVTPYSKQSTLNKGWDDLYAQIVETHQNSLAVGFDNFIATQAPIAGVDTLAASASIELEAPKTFDALVAAKKAVGATGTRVNGYVTNALGEVTLSSGTDNTGRPLFSTSNETTSNLFGSPLAVTTADLGANVLGFAGDFDQLVIGFHPEGVTAQVLTEYAEIGGQPRALKQHNEVAVFFEVPVSVAVLRPNAFVKIVDAA